MFREVVRVKAGPVVFFHDVQALLVQLARRATSPVEMIENSKG
jgi:hypothetical protein